jgi:thiamine biosynthesis lipoprotein
MKTKSLFLLLLATLVTSGCLNMTHPAHSERIHAFGTIIEVTIVDKAYKEAKANIQQIRELFEQLHNDWHAWNKGPLQDINEALAQGQSHGVPAPLLPLIHLSIPLAVASDHLFNPAIGRLIDLWGFQGKPGACDRLPSQAQIQALVRQNPRMTDLMLNGNQISSTNPSVKLDFGAVGKGYGIDLAMDRLKALGVEHAIINAGGDLRAIGSRDGRPWRIGVKHPDGSILASLEVQGDESVFTSGYYERYYECNGQRYHHIIDPRSGLPAKGSTQVTVIHPNATTADAAATALFIAGPKDWEAIARKLGIQDIALLNDQGRLFITPSMEKRLKILKEVRVQLVPLDSQPSGKNVE